MSTMISWNLYELEIITGLYTFVKDRALVDSWYGNEKPSEEQIRDAILEWEGVDPETAGVYDLIPEIIMDTHFVKKVGIPHI